jgi:hypothetical protein
MYVLLIEEPCTISEYEKLLVLKEFYYAVGTIFSCTYNMILGYTPDPGLRNTTDKKF